MTDAFSVSGEDGTITVTAAALTRLVVHAAERVDGAAIRRPRRSVEVDIDGGRARVSVHVCARYGTPLPQLAREVQERVAGAVRATCDVEVDAVDVAVEELDD